MAKQLNVNLAFSADTGKAKAQIQDLQNSLNNLVKSSAAGAVSKGLPITKDLMEAQTAASKLQTILSQSMNTKTGNLDLTKFSESLNKANLNITKLENSLTKLGPEGQKAFMSLTQSIVSADVPLRRTNVLVSEMWTTMKNTARWQLSSSVLHGFMGSLQSAMGYARDLDESLNNIRIVTGQNVDQMAAFADRANKAAKALSATTTQYTNASLIYYQQGLSDAEVQERADITIKMAHASGQSAEIVSDQLTAVWNNFAKGGEDLEHFADVMTALGAATASSSDEIAGGLEKFASIAEMIGLSYEYAASALATITATTRQSEDVVGTALKTIFARIQGLNLGETLDDGTTLNKYSEALQKVGISIYEQNGELKDMDNILNEMGAKWDTLSKDQQVALAQTVAGVRQYNQLVSLMDNWDFFQENLDISNNSEGALQEQADIYAESWQAARDRVKAAAQDIYDSILDPDFFITLLNLLEDVLSGVANLTDALGGLPGILSLLGVVGTKVFENQLAGAVERLAFNLKSFVGITQQTTNTLQSQALKIVTDMQFNTGTAEGNMEAVALQKRLQLQELIKKSSMGMTEEAKEQLNTVLQLNDAYAQQAVEIAKAKDQASNEASEARQDIRQEMRRQGASEQDFEKLNQATQEIKQFQEAGVNATQFLKDLDSSFTKADVGTTKLSKGAYNLSEALRKIGLNKTADEIEELRKKLNNGTISFEEFKKAVNEKVNIDDLRIDFGYQGQAQSKSLDELIRKFGLTDEVAERYGDTLFRLDERTLEEARANDRLNESFLSSQEAILNFKDNVNKFGQSIVKAAQGISSITMGLTSLKSAFDTLNNDDLSFGEKLLQVSMSLSMAIPALASGFVALKEAELGKTLADIKATASGAIEAIVTERQAAAAGTATVANRGFITTLYGKAAAAVAAKLGISALTAGILTLVGAIAGIVIIAGVLIKVFEAIKNASPEAQLDRLKDKADKSAEAFDRVTASVNETNDAIQNLENSYDVIDSLTKGTTEWYEAISKANAEVLDLLKLYPELSEHIYQDDGVLKISDEGKKVVNEINRKNLASANNIRLSDDIAVQEQELKNSYRDYTFTNNIGANATLAKGIQEYYNNPQVGELLFSDEISRQVFDSLKEAGNLQNVSLDQFRDSLKENADMLRENAAKQKSIDLLKDQQTTLISSSFGSSRSAEELREIGVDSSEAYSITRNRIANNKISEGGFGNWKSSDKYMESDPQWEMIQDFLRTQGNNAEYVKQKNGKMVISIDGEEIEYSKDEVYDSLASLYMGEELEEQISDGLSKTLSKALGRSVRKASTESLVLMDEFRRGIGAALEGTEDEGKTDTIFKSMYNSYSEYTDDAGQTRYKSAEDTMSAIQEDTQYVDFQSSDFSQLVVDLNDGKIKAQEFTEEIKKLNAEGQIAASGDYFSEMAEKYGFDDEAAQQMQDYAKQLIEVADESDLLDDSLDQNADTAAAVSVAVTKMNRGIDTLADNFSDWNSILKKSDKSSAEYSQAINGMRDALSDVLNVESDIISNDFIEEHLDEIAKAAQGDAEAIDALKEALATDILLEVTGKTNLEEVDKEISDLHNKILGMDNNIEVGATLEDGEFLTKAQELIDKSGMTVAEAQAYFNSLGYEPEFVTEEKTVTRSVPQERTHTDYEITDGYVDIMGAQVPIPTIDRLTTTSISGYKDVEEKIQVPAFGNDNPKIKSLKKTSSGGLNNYSSSNSGGKGPGKSGKSGGGGSKSKPAEKVDLTRRDEIVDRYKEINDTLADIDDAMSDVNKEADRLFGSARLKAMRQEKDLLLQQADALKKKKLEAENYYNTDKQSLITESAKYGITWEFGKDGDILNYTDQMNKLFNELNAAEVKMNGLATKEAQDEYKTATIEPIQQKIEDIKNALSQYEDTKELLKDLDNQLQEAIWAWQDKNFEELEYKLELKLDIDDADLKHLDYLMNKWSDDFFKMAETAALMYSRTEYDQVDGYSNQLANYREHELALKEKYANDEISQADYIEGLKNVRDGYYEQLEALNELDKTMLHYYEDTLSAAAEELSDYTDHMKHLTGVFDYYLNLMDLLGKQKDFDALGDFLGGKAETTRDQLNVAKEYYDMLLEQKEETEREYNKAIRSGDEESIKFWQEQWDAIVDATDEAQEEMLSLTETWVENMRAVIQNNMDKLAADLEKSLTGEFMNFDVLMDSFDKLNTRQEEYLTKTNQIYETNKLIRQASQKIDETDNKVAKQKMQNFITETKSLQENNQLSEYELEIQQAKYELLLAEIALEEAQNAKSTVRLSRDSEGNFGYVYTADQDAVDDAEQGLDDAKNRLYNLSLEGQQEYTEKYLQAQQSMYEELTELQQMFLDGELASEEEYQLRKEEIINHYYGENGILRTYSNLYNVAVQTDAAATADYWGKQYGAMTQATDDWQVAVNKYLEEVEEETEEWADVSKQANRDVEGALKNSSKATKELTSESDKLGKEIRNDLIPAMDKEFERIQKNIKEYERERDAIRDMIEEYEEYIRLINQNIKDASDDEDNSSESSFTNKKYRDDYAADIRDLVLNKGFEIESDTVQTLLEERQEKIDSDPNKWSAMSNEELINNIERDKKKVTSMATGGFTGVWGPEGKLAFLHEKELVLNQDDTSNLLKTISFIREIVNMIDSQASFANLGFLSTPGFSNAIDRNFEQTVSIYAEFPSATNHTEIEEAFNNLLNTASQYANRKE